MLTLPFMPSQYQKSLLIGLAQALEGIQVFIGTVLLEQGGVAALDRALVGIGGNSENAPAIHGSPRQNPRSS